MLASSLRRDATASQILGETYRQIMSEGDDSSEYPDDKQLVYAKESDKDDVTSKKDEEYVASVLDDPLLNGMFRVAVDDHLRKRVEEVHEDTK